MIVNCFITNCISMDSCFSFQNVLLCRPEMPCAYFQVCCFVHTPHCSTFTCKFSVTLSLCSGLACIHMFYFFSFISIFPAFECSDSTPGLFPSTSLYMLFYQFICFPLSVFLSLSPPLSPCLPPPLHPMVAVHKFIE